MRGRLSSKLRAIVAAPQAARAPEVAAPARPEGLGPEARRVARLLRMEAERATKGRACRFTEAEGGLRAVLEGHDAGAVARQVARRFEGEAGWRAVVERDRRGAAVVLRAIEEAAVEPFSDVEAIQHDVVQWAKQHLPKEITVQGVQGTIFVDVKGTSATAKEALLDAKQQVGAYLLQHFGHRTWIKAKHRGFKMWTYDFGGRPEGVRVGFEVKRTPEEAMAVLAGPSAWHAIQKKDIG